MSRQINSKCHRNGSRVSSSMEIYSNNTNSPKVSFALKKDQEFISNVKRKQKDSHEILPNTKETIVKSGSPTAAKQTPQTCSKHAEKPEKKDNNGEEASNLKMQFLDFLMSKKYEEALKVTETLLQINPSDAVVQEYLPLLRDMIQLHNDDEDEDDDEEDDDDEVSSEDSDATEE